MSCEFMFSDEKHFRQPENRCFFPTLLLQCPQNEWSYTMEKKVINFLQTQGLRLPEKEVVDAAVIFNTLFLHVQADSLKDKLLNHLAEKIGNLPLSFAALCRMAAMADILFSQYPCQHLSLWHLQDTPPTQMDCLLFWGEKQEDILTVNELTSHQHLAAQTALSGWLHYVDNLDVWLAEKWLVGTRHQPKGKQWAIPICKQSGVVWGILYGEANSEQEFSESAQCAWVGFAIALGGLIENQSISSAENIV